jgi:hypothetical protein
MHLRRLPRVSIASDNLAEQVQETAVPAEDVRNGVMVQYVAGRCGGAVEA